MPAPHTSCSLFQALLTEKELLPQSPVHLDAPVMLMVLYFFTFFFFFTAEVELRAATAVCGLELIRRGVSAIFPF